MGVVDGHPASKNPNCSLPMDGRSRSLVSSEINASEDSHFGVIGVDGLVGVDTG